MDVWMCELCGGQDTVSNYPNYLIYRKANNTQSWTTSAFPLCAACSPGEFTASGCQKCGTGRFTSTMSEADQPQCQECPIGFSQSSIGTTMCNKCKGGQFQHERGQNSCEDCSTGQYRTSHSVEISCTQCPRGYHQSVKGESACVFCLEGQFEDELGSSSTSCENCNASTYSSKTKTECLNCPIGWKSSSKQDDCKECEAGQYETGQQTTCETCKAGKYSDTTGKTTCKTCAAGYFSKHGEITSCKPCPAGKRETNNIRCQQCAAGRHSDIPGSSTCEDCSANTFGESPGQTKCKECDSGQASKEKSTTCTQCGYKWLDSNLMDYQVNVYNDFRILNKHTIRNMGCPITHPHAREHVRGNWYCYQNPDKSGSVCSHTYGTDTPNGQGQWNQNQDSCHIDTCPSTHPHPGKYLQSWYCYEHFHGGQTGIGSVCSYGGSEPTPDGQGQWHQNQKQCDIERAPNHANYCKVVGTRVRCVAISKATFHKPGKVCFSASSNPDGESVLAMFVGNGYYAKTPIYEENTLVGPDIHRIFARKGRYYYNKFPYKGLNGAKWDQSGQSMCTENGYIPGETAFITQIYEGTLNGKGQVSSDDSTYRIGVPDICLNSQIELSN